MSTSIPPLDVAWLKSRLIQLETENTILRQKLVSYHFLVKWLYSVCGWFFSYYTLYSKGTDNFNKQLFLNEVLSYPVKVTNYIEKYSSDLVTKIKTLNTPPVVINIAVDIPHLNIEEIGNLVNMNTTYFISETYSRSDNYKFIRDFNRQEAAEWNAFLSTYYPGFDVRRFVYDIDIHMLNMNMARDFFLRIGMGSFDLFFDKTFSSPYQPNTPNALEADLQVAQTTPIADMKVAFDTIKSNVFNFWKNCCKIIVDSKTEFYVSDIALAADFDREFKTFFIDNYNNYKDYFDKIPAKEPSPVGKYICYPVETVRTVNTWLEILTENDSTVLKDIFTEIYMYRTTKTKYDLVNYQVKNICIIDQSELFIDKVIFNVCNENFILKSILRVLIRRLKDFSRIPLNMKDPFLLLATKLGENLEP